MRPERLVDHAETCNDVGVWKRSGFYLDGNRKMLESFGQKRKQVQKSYIGYFLF